MQDNYLRLSARLVTTSQSFTLSSRSTAFVSFRPISPLSMAHQHSSSQPVRRSTRQKSSKKDAETLYSELPGQWQDFKFLDVKFLQPAITKQGAAEAAQSSPSASSSRFFSCCRPYSSFQHTQFGTANPPN